MIVANSFIWFGCIIKTFTKMCLDYYQYCRLKAQYLFMKYVVQHPNTAMNEREIKSSKPTVHVTISSLHIATLFSLTLQ